MLYEVARDADREEESSRTEGEQIAVLQYQLQLLQDRARRRGNFDGVAVPGRPRYAQVREHGRRTGRESEERARPEGFAAARIATPPMVEDLGLEHPEQEFV